MDLLLNILSFRFGFISHISLAKKCSADISVPYSTLRLLFFTSRKYILHFIHSLTHSGRVSCVQREGFCQSLTVFYFIRPSNSHHQHSDLFRFHLWISDSCGHMVHMDHIASRFLFPTRAKSRESGTRSDDKCIWMFFPNGFWWDYYLSTRSRSCGFRTAKWRLDGNGLPANIWLWLQGDDKQRTLLMNE